MHCVIHAAEVSRCRPRRYVPARSRLQRVRHGSQAHGATCLPGLGFSVFGTGHKPGPGLLRRRDLSFEPGPQLGLLARGVLPHRGHLLRGGRCFGLRRKPGRLALAVFRLPLKAYQHNAGPAVGRTFVAFTHVGRKTGRRIRPSQWCCATTRQTGEAVICAGGARKPTGTGICMSTPR